MAMNDNTISPMPNEYLHINPPLDLLSDTIVQVSKKQAGDEMGYRDMKYSREQSYSRARGLNGSVEPEVCSAFRKTTGGSRVSSMGLDLRIWPLSFLGRFSQGG